MRIVLYPGYHTSTLKLSGPLQSKEGLILRENTRALTLPGSSVQQQQQLLSLGLLTLHQLYPPQGRGHLAHSPGGLTWLKLGPRAQTIASPIVHKGSVT